MKKYITGNLSNNAYFLPEWKVLIDAPLGIKEQINPQNIKKVFLTHGHYDHTEGLPEIIADNPDVEVYLSKRELNFLKDHTPDLFSQVRWEFFPEEKDKLFGEIEVIETPGHTPGSVCFLLGNELFSGDTLFKGTVGRTDLRGGDENLLQNSLQNLLELLPPEIVVYPGHGEETSISASRKMLGVLP